MTDNSKDRVNPFLTEMYYRLSFTTWLKLMKKQKKNEDLDKAKKLTQNPDESNKVEDELEETNKRGHEEVIIDVPHLIEMSMSSDEEEEFNQAKKL